MVGGREGRREGEDGRYRTGERRTREVVRLGRKDSRGKENKSGRKLHARM